MYWTLASAAGGRVRVFSAAKAVGCVKYPSPSRAKARAPSSPKGEEKDVRTVDMFVVTLEQQLNVAPRLYISAAGRMRFSRRRRCLKISFKQTGLRAGRVFSHEFP